MSLIVRSIILVLLACSTASAVELRENRPGDVLIFPYFNMTNGWDTYIDIINSGVPEVQFPEILKIHVRDGRTGVLVNTFNYYNYKPQAENLRLAIGKLWNDLPPHRHRRIKGGSTVLVVAEGSCVVADDLWAGFPTGSATVFELGTDIGTLEVYAVTARLTSEIQESVSSCEDLADFWRSGGIWDVDPLDGIQESSGVQISGLATLIHGYNGVSVDYDPLILGDFSLNIEHTSPSSRYPNLADADPIAVLPNGTEFIPSSGEGIDAVARIIGIGGSPSLTNQVITAPEVGATTDWIISYPLAGYKQYKPFTVQIKGEERACESFGLDLFDRDPLVEPEATVEISSDDIYQGLYSWGNEKEKGFRGGDISPIRRLEAGASLCNAVNVVTFDGALSSLLETGSDHIYQLEGVLADSSSSTLRWKLIDPGKHPSIGRPVVAYGVTVFANGTFDGGNVLANYATLRRHYLFR